MPLGILYWGENSGEKNQATRKVSPESLIKNRLFFL
jgi:hypothetical protein